MITATMAFTGMAQFFPDSNSGPCFVDLAVTGQDSLYTITASPTGSYNPSSLTYTWTLDGVYSSGITGNTFTLVGAPGDVYDVCVTIPCDTGTATNCLSVYIDSNNVTPIDSLFAGCLTGIYVDNQNEYFYGYATFNGMYDPNDLTWDISGPIDTMIYGDYPSAILPDGAYTICATYDGDSCTTTICDSIFISGGVGNPLDSLEDACLTGISLYGYSGYLSATALFDGADFDLNDLTWSINGVVDTTIYGDFVYTPMADGTYYVCATYNGDSCTATFCDSVVVSGNGGGNPVDSFACLTGIDVYGQAGFFYAYANFDNMGFDPTAITWTVDGVSSPMYQGDYIFDMATPGTYYVCVTYTSDSCSATYCDSVVVTDPGNPIDSTIYIDSIAFGDWILNNWDSILVDSTLLDELDDWDIEEWSDSLIFVIFGDSININDLDSNDIYVILGGLDQDDIDSLLAMGVAGFDFDDLDEYWEDFLDENDNLDGQGLTFNDLLGLFGGFLEAKATEVLSIEEVPHTEIGIFFNPNTHTLTIDSDQIGLINVYNIQGQRVFTRNENNPQLNLSSINTGVYILSIEINGKLYSHKIVK